MKSDPAGNRPQRRIDTEGGGGGQGGGRRHAQSEVGEIPLVSGAPGRVRSKSGSILPVVSALPGDSVT